ncbi:hypothetical protein [Bradyrhizobium sp. SYSU BS000235]|uniref:hypothetical protein n=1 Tax=Bradyrhizobium sp. SYSU BS000235 TaxID=3411332 RepID=UPI003C7187A5
MQQGKLNHLDEAAEDRRKFLAACGRFAVVTPPAITLLLSTSLNSTAVANSNGGNGKVKPGNNGFGNGGGDGGNKQDVSR